MRYGFFLYEVRKPSSDEVEWELISFREVNPERDGFAELTAQLLPWATDVLRAGKHEFSLFSVEFSEVNEYGDPEICVCDSYLAWNGGRQIASGELSVYGPAA